MTLQLALTTQEPQRAAGRHLDDFYATPPWVSRLLIDFVDADGWVDQLDGRHAVVEPSCGDGAMLDVLRETVAIGSTLMGVELNRDRARETRIRGHIVERADFLEEWAPKHPVMWIPGNPPFSMAQRFVERAMELLEPGGQVTFLLRLAFMASQKRASLYAPGFGFHSIGVLPKRPSFVPSGTTDKYDYAILNWRKGFEGVATIRRLELEQVTPAEGRGLPND